MVEIEGSTETRAAADLAIWAVVVARALGRADQAAAESLMKPLALVVGDEFAHQQPEVGLAENDEVVEALLANGPENRSA